MIKTKLSHGIRGTSPVLLGVESEAKWLEHYKGVREALAPGDEFEEDLVYLIAWQLWRFSRLIRHETELTSQKIANPDLTFCSGHLSKEAVRKVLTQPQRKLDREYSVAQEFLERCAAISRCAPMWCSLQGKFGKFSRLFLATFKKVSRSG